MATMGGILDAQGRTEEEFLAAYDISAYPQPSVTVDDVVMTVDDNDLRVLLVRRGGHPFLGQWALPGGFVSMEESTDDAVVREVREETGIKVGDRIGYFEQLRTFSAPYRDPRGRIISVAYMALLPSARIGGMEAGDDASDAAWFSVRLIGDDGECVMLTQVMDEEGDEEPVTLFLGDEGARAFFSEGRGDLGRLAFDHEEILKCAIARLRAKIVYSCIAFSLLDDPCCFTLTELRHVYEAVTGRRYDMGNFQRMFKNLFVKPGLAEANGAADTKGRPATTYEFVGKGYDEIVR